MDVQQTAKGLVLVRVRTPVRDLVMRLAMEIANMFAIIIVWQNANQTHIATALMSQTLQRLQYVIPL